MLLLSPHLLWWTEPVVGNWPKGRHGIGWTTVYNVTWSQQVNGANQNLKCSKNVLMKAGRVETEGSWVERLQCHVQAGYKKAEAIGKPRNWSGERKGWVSAAHQSKMAPCIFSQPTDILSWHNSHFPKVTWQSLLFAANVSKPFLFFLFSLNCEVFTWSLWAFPFFQ